MKICKHIKDARIKKNITQEELAEQLGVSRQTISSWENERSYPDIISIIKISDIFDISLDKLLKEDKNLVNDMQKQMDTVKSNKAIIYTVILAIITYGAIYLIKTFINIPKIDNLWLNLLIIIVFIIGTLVYILTNLNISNFLNKKTSNKSIIKTIVTMLMIITIIFTFPLIEKITLISWQILTIRICIILFLIIICLFIFKKIDKY